MPMIGGSGIRHVIPPTLQADAVLSQASPVSGTKYTILSTTANVKILSAMASVTWTVQPTPLELHFTIDGNDITHSIANPASVTNYAAERWVFGAAAGQILTLWSSAASAKYLESLYENKSVKIEAETTGGTTSNLAGRVKYGKW